MIHEFKECLDESHRMQDLPIWTELYAKAFPGGVAIPHPTDGEHQRAGIDRSVVLANSKQILIDEKVRHPHKDGRPWVWDDVLLEYVSNDRTNAPGWVVKALRADYIAYAILQTGKCYLLPVIQLQQAWLKHRDAWLAKYKVRAAQNRTYRTLSCPVPVDVLFPAIGSCLRAECTPMSWEQLSLFMSTKAA